MVRMRKERAEPKGGFDGGERGRERVRVRKVGEWVAGNGDAKW